MSNEIGGDKESLTIDRAKELLFGRYYRMILQQGRDAAEGLNTLQDVASDFGWTDILEKMQEMARKHL